jgi:hypothetical protein
MGSTRGRGIVGIIEATVLSDRFLKECGSRQLIGESLRRQTDQGLGCNLVELTQRDRSVGTGIVTQ